MFSFPPVSRVGFSLLLASVCLPSLAFGAETTSFENDFEKAAVGSAPTEATILAGEFKVAEEGGNKFLELPGSPLDTFGLLFGPAGEGARSASARFFATKQGRKFPTFGISIGGVSGYRLQASPAKRMLEIFKGDEPLATAPLVWESGAWMALSLSAKKAGAGWVIEGLAAGAGQPQRVRFETAEPPPAGRAGIWGSPYAGTPIRFDDLRLGSGDQ